MDVECLAGAHHGGAWRIGRAMWDTCPRRLGTVDMPESQLAHSEIVLNLAVTGPSARKTGQPGQGHAGLTPLQIALGLRPIGPQPPVVESPESHANGQKSDQVEPPSPIHHDPPTNA